MAETLAALAARSEPASPSFVDTRTMLTYSTSPDIMVIYSALVMVRCTEYPSDAHAARLRSAALSVLLCALLRVGKYIMLGEDRLKLTPPSSLFWRLGC